MTLVFSSTTTHFLDRNQMEKLFILILLRQTYVTSLSLCDTGDCVLEADETKNSTTFMCTGIPSQHTVEWQVFYGNTFRLGYCPPPSSGQSTCVPQELKNAFQLYRTSATEGSLSALSGGKTQADTDTLTCRDLNTTEPGVTCPLDYVYPGEGVACSAEFSSVTWSLAAGCAIAKIRSVKRRYKCQLLQVNQATGTKLQLQYVNMTTTPTGNTNYMSGVCNITSYLPSDGQYIYTVTIFPGNIDVTAVFKGDNRIRRPSFPPSNDCPMSVKESDTLDCTCSVSDSGIPQGLLQWNVTGSKRLLLTRVQRQQNGLTSVCSLAWNNTELRSSYTLIVTYPPTQLSFKFTNTGTDSLNVTENAGVTMVCQSDGRPTPNMTISKIIDNRVLASLPAGNITLAEKTGELSYTVTAAQCEDSDVYKCTADNSIGRNEQSIKLAVTCKPRRHPINDTSAPSVTFEGQPVQVVFKLVAYPTPVVTSKTWLGPSINDSIDGNPASDSVIQADCSSSSVQIYATDCIMTINNLTSNTAGFYKVNVSNGFGSLILTFEVAHGNIYTDNTPDQSPVGAIAGGVVGGLAAICLTVVITIFLIRRKENQHADKNSSRTTKTHVKGRKGDKQPIALEQSAASPKNGTVLSMSPSTESVKQNIQGETTKKGKRKGKGAQEAKRRNENLVYTTVVFSNEATGSHPAPAAESTEYATIVEQTSAKN